MGGGEREVSSHGQNVPRLLKEFLFATSNMDGVLNNPCYVNDIDKTFLINMIKWINCTDLPSLRWWIGE